MSQDPNSHYGSDPHNPYGAAPQGPYYMPPNAYPPFGVPPTGSYPASPYPAGAPDPSMPPWAYPPYPPYPPMPYPGPDPQGYGYGYPPPYGGPTYPGYNPPPAPKTPLKEALRQLPRQYLRVLTRPSAATFAEEMGKADWSIVWVELLAYALACAILYYIFFQEFLHILISLPPFATIINDPNVNGQLIMSTMQTSLTTSAISQIISAPIRIFLNVGIYYLIAKLFKGKGEFLTQLYSTLLFFVPLNIIALLLMLIPFVGWVLAFALSIYSIVLYINMLMAVHRFSGGRATLVYFIPAIVGFILLAALIAFYVFLIYSIMHTMPHSYLSLWHG